MDGDVIGQPKAHRGSSGVWRFPHTVLQFCRSTSTSWRAQEHPHGRFIARDVELGGREKVTGDVVTGHASRRRLSLEMQGEKNTAHATKDGCPY